MSTTTRSASESQTAVYHRSIDGLRAVAVLLVVLFHAEIPGFSRGYLGVDMFLAISGFLITTRLLRRPSDQHLQPLRQFWAARTRRIVPAVTLVIVVTCIGSAVVFAPQELERVGFYGLASDFFVMNIAAAVRGANYFAGPLRDSPFLHMWSLGLEEQFYLVWPFVLGPLAAGAYRLVGRRTRLTQGRGRVLASLLVAILVASFLLQLAWAGSQRLWAFYLLPARMFEFLLGGVASLFLVRRVTPGVRTPLTIGGLALVAVAVFWPGEVISGPWLMLLSAGGTTAVMLGTAARSGQDTQMTPLIQPLLESRPAAAIGRYSYSWYLWHWPAFVLVLAAMNGARVWAQVACIASILPAMAAYHVVENPFRRSTRLVGSWRLSLLTGAALVTLAAIACLALMGWGRAGTRDPQIALWIEAEQSFDAADCQPNNQLLGVEVCLGGSTDPGAPLVLLVGDSHAAQWASAFSRAGEEAGFAVAVRWSGSCAAAGTRAGEDGLPQSYIEGCEDFQTETLELVSSEEVDAVIVSDATGSRPEDPSVWGDAMRRLVEESSASGTPMGVMVDNPHAGDVLRCLSRGGGEKDCLVPRGEATAEIERYAPEIDGLVAATSAQVLDLTDQICPADPCPVELDGVVVPAGSGHLNRSFTHTFQDRLSGFARQLLG